MSPAFTTTLLALAALSQAVPHGGNEHMHAHGRREAAAAPAVTAAPELNARADYSCQNSMAPIDSSNDVTIQIVNSMDTPLSMTVSNVAGALSGSPTGALTLTSSTAMVAPQGWAGNFGIGRQSSDANSLIEMNVDSGNGLWPDISYVKGYSVPIVCSCGEGENIITGSNQDLGTCANEIDGACPNPMTTFADTEPDAFFKDAQACAYTFPADDNAMGHCGSNQIWCCVGTSCPSNNRSACTNHMTEASTC